MARARDDARWDGPAAGAERPEDTLRAWLASHLSLVGRVLRRMGVRDADVEDATQKVFMTAHQRRGCIAPGKEKAYLIAIALRVASHETRARRRREGALARFFGFGAEVSPSPEVLSEERQAREALERILSVMPRDLRAVFVLFELEELPTAEIADLLGLAAGTVASRLRRARALFAARTSRLRQEELR